MCATSDRPAEPREPLFLRLQVPSTLMWIEVVRLAIRSFVWDLDAAVAERVELPVIEAVTNAIRHAHEQDPELPIEIDLERDGDRLRCSIYDRGPGFDLPPGPSTASADPGGRGLRLIRDSTDGASVHRLGGGSRVDMWWRVANAAER